MSIGSRFRRGAEEYASGLERFAEFIEERQERQGWGNVVRRVSQWERELDIIGEQLSGQPVVGQALLPIISHLFVVLQTIVGTIGLIGRLPIGMARFGAVYTRFEAGITTPEEFLEELTPFGQEGLDLLIGGLRSARDHFREGIAEGNGFRITVALDEFVLAILALIGIFRGVRGAIRPTGVRPGAASGAAGETAAGGRISAPTEAVEGGRPAGVEPGSPRRIGGVGGPPRIRRSIGSVDEARRIVQEYYRGQSDITGSFDFNMENLTSEYRVRGGTDPVPAAFIDTNGRLYFNGENLGLRGQPGGSPGAPVPGAGPAGASPAAAAPEAPTSGTADTAIDVEGQTMPGTEPAPGGARPSPAAEAEARQLAAVRANLHIWRSYPDMESAVRIFREYQNSLLHRNRFSSYADAPMQRAYESYGGERDAPMAFECYWRDPDPVRMQLIVNEAVVRAASSTP